MKLATKTKAALQKGGSMEPPLDPPLQYVICAKHEIQIGVTVVVLHMPSVEHYHFLPSTSPFSTWNASTLTRSPKGVTVHKFTF